MGRRTTSRPNIAETLPLDVDLDSTSFAHKWDRGWPGGTGVVLGFKVDTRAEVDELVAALAADGVPVQQEPYDAFWGARYAVVSDPDGNGVGIMSPVDPARRTRAARPTVSAIGRRGDRRGDRDPHGQPQQVRVRPRAARDPAGPPPLHRHHLSGGLRLRPRHPGRRRRPARRAGAGDRPDLPRLRRAGADPRHVLHARREGHRRQADLCARARPAVGRRPRHRRRPPAPAQRDRPLLQHLQGPRAGEADRGAGLRRTGRRRWPSSRRAAPPTAVES